MPKDTDNLPASETKDQTAASTSRRTFVLLAAGAVGCATVGAIGYPVFRYLYSPVEKDIAEEKNNTVELKGADKLPPGSTLMFFFNSEQSMLIHFADGTWVALSAICTHLGCTVTYHAPDALIMCPCHGGQYDPHTGKNVSGPPPKPLTRYAVDVTPGKVTVTRA